MLHLFVEENWFRQLFNIILIFWAFFSFHLVLHKIGKKQQKEFETSNYSIWTNWTWKEEWSILNTFLNIANLGLMILQNRADFLKCWMTETHHNKGGYSSCPRKWKIQVVSLCLKGAPFLFCKCHPVVMKTWKILRGTWFF